MAKSTLVSALRIGRASFARSVAVLRAISASRAAAAFSRAVVVRLEIDDQLVAGQQLERHVARLCALENPVHESGPWRYGRDSGTVPERTPARTQMDRLPVGIWMLAKPTETIVPV